MTRNGFTLVNPNDRGMLDVVGFDASGPGLESQLDYPSLKTPCRV